ncbi:MAG: diguanylate cyclase domain-containing protein [Spirochaetaceae bacterium]
MSPSIKQRFIMIHVTMLLVPVALMGVIITLLVRQDIEQRVHEEQSTAIDSIKRQVVDRHTRAIRNVLSALAEEQDLWRMFDDPDVRARIHEDWEVVQEIFPERAWIYYGDRHNRISVVPQWDAPPEYDLRQRPWYVAAKETGRLTWVQPYTEYTTGETIFSASIPVTNDEGEFTGVLAIDTFLKEFFTDMRLQAREEASELLVVTESGSAFSLAPEAPGTVEPDASYPWNELFESPGEDGYIQLGDRQYHAVYTELSPLPFFLVSLTPRSAVFEEIIPLLSIIVTFTVLALLVSGGGSVHLARYVVRNIRSLNSYMNEVTGGKLTTKTCVDGEDEFLSLNTYLNSMVRTLSQQIENHRRTGEELADRNEQLDRLVNRDGLTRIANHRAFYETLREEWSRMHREKRPLSLLFIDIDFFKQYNDLYGHQAGDECLREFASLLQETARRPADLAARYGGEEFVVLLPNTSSAGAEETALRFQRRLAELRIPHERSAVAPHLTCSIGVATTVPDRSHSMDEFVAGADRAVYLAKRRGRNRIAFARSAES